MATPNRKKPTTTAGRAASVTLPSIAEGLRTMDENAALCSALLGVRSTEHKIPAAMRSQLKKYVGFPAWWAKNRSLYLGLMGIANATGAGSTGGGKASRATA